MKRLIACISVCFTLFCETPSRPEVQKSILAGQWYSANREELSSQIRKLLARDKGSDPFTLTRPLLLIVPHAGYAHSGDVAAAGYTTIKNNIPDIIIIIAPSHYSSFYGCALLSADYYETPLGRIKLAKEYTEILGNSDLFNNNRNEFSQEHAIEIQLPFLQMIYGEKLSKDIAVLPIISGDINTADAIKAATTLTQAIKDKKMPLFIISSDFTHYGDRFGYTPFKSTDRHQMQKIHDLDNKAIDYIVKKDATGFEQYVKKTGITICGKNPILIALSLPINHFNARLVRYATSGSVSGDYENTVSYAAITATGVLLHKNAASSIPDTSLTDKDKKYLLNLARQNIRSQLFRKMGSEPDTHEVPANCQRNAGAFVTLKKDGMLRGCIGSIEPSQPLFRTVIDNSYNAAFRDPRFPALSQEEFENITIEISVITAPRQIESLEDIIVGRDGLIIEQGDRRGLLLPQVPIEWGWSKEEFLIHTCRKAGLPDYAWKHGARILTFQAIVFDEHKP